jgi:anti-sigma regulatory factor (Ser/Thr protein kinase)
MANAGHPPAVLVGAGGCTLWEGPVGPPLGASLGPYSTATRSFPPGAGLLLYTDGLIEHRDSDLDVGITQLLAAVASASDQDLERLADAALAVQALGQHDDVALLAVRAPPVDLPQAMVVDLYGDNRAARTTRRATAEALAGWEVTGAVGEDAVLLATELVNNAITHTGRPRQLRVRRLTDRLVIEVADADPRPPQRLVPDESSEGGRGLTIVAALSSAWGVRFDGAGKIVWCEVPLQAA